MARLSRTAILARDAAQVGVIATLTKAGQHEVARRLTGCLATRIFRPPTSMWRPRCRGAGCLACWSGSLSRRWSAYQTWCRDDPAAYSIVIPADLRFAAPLARAVRDDRDREARQDPAWAEIAVMGLTDGTRAYLTISPWGVPSAKINAVLSRRWPTLVVGGNDGPDPISSIDVRAALAVRKRGSAPLQFIVLPQRLDHEPPTEPDFIPFEFESRLLLRF